MDHPYSCAEQLYTLIQLHFVEIWPKPNLIWLSIERNTTKCEVRIQNRVRGTPNTWCVTKYVRLHSLNRNHGITIKSLVSESWSSYRDAWNHVTFNRNSSKGESKFSCLRKIKNFKKLYFEEINIFGNLNYNMKLSYP